MADNEDESEFFMLNVDCIYLIFDRLNLSDLCAISKTCTYIQKLAKTYFKSKYANYVINIRRYQTHMVKPQKTMRMRVSPVLQFKYKVCSIAVTDVKIIECFGDVVKFCRYSDDGRNVKLRQEWFLQRLKSSAYYLGKVLFPHNARNIKDFEARTRHLKAHNQFQY